MAEEEAVQTEESTEQEAEAVEAEGKDYRAELRKYERTAKAAAKKKDAEIAKLQKQVQDLTEQTQTDREKELEDARREAAEQAKKETAGEYQDRILKAEIRARAAGKFANPALAPRLVDIEDPFDENGELQGDALDAALDAVIEENPNLAPGDPNPGDPDAGKGGGSDATAEAMSVTDHLKDIQGGE